MSAEEADEEVKAAPPSVESSDQTERIEARRLRVAARVEALKRAILGETSSLSLDALTQGGQAQRREEESRQRLDKLLEDGTELVSNVRVAVDAREVQRRAHNEEARRLRLEKLESEARESLEKFERIASGWHAPLGGLRDFSGKTGVTADGAVNAATNGTKRALPVPQALRDALHAQQKLCAALIEDKNKLITELEQELKTHDEQFVRDLKRQATDIELLTERMEEQARSVAQTCREEMTSLEKEFEAERRELLEKNRKEWEQATHTRRDREEQQLEGRLRRAEDQEQQLQDLRRQGVEEINEIKEKLEGDVQALQQQLQQMKATYQLNQEKLEYNFHVLKKRDEENALAKALQKRRLTRQQDLLTSLKARYAKMERQYKDENLSLASDFTRMSEEQQQVHSLTSHFGGVDARRFRGVWLMAEEEARRLARRALDADRAITEQQLGLDWEAPPDSEALLVGPSRLAVGSHRTAAELTKSILTTPGGLKQEDEEVEEKVREADTSKEGRESPALTPATLKRILELLSDESGFLVEQKLLKLLEPLPRDERSLLTLHTVLTALGLETEEDVKKLAEFFLAFGKERKAERAQLWAAVKGSERAASLKKENGEAGAAKVEEVGGGRDRKEERDGEQLSEQEKEERDADGRNGGETEGGQHPWAPTSDDLIDPDDVLLALKLFMKEHRKPNRSGFDRALLEAGLGERDEERDQEYWHQLAGIIPDERLTVWDALLQGLDKYHTVLSARESLVGETEALRRQNAELRLLLQQYMHTRVNPEMKEPSSKSFEWAVLP
ncbi:dynein regulatory complex protein 1 [Lethenteron reissneri]|uniref:dynein regulatory complex protein 1 n=1 Tax=Lethenteron reissneri TaxID=7753 RepID=UPI002AB60E09|nr:dynein regulatory complex protein 1 [Lethenteron reissneri]